MSGRMSLIIRPFPFFSLNPRQAPVVTETVLRHLSQGRFSHKSGDRGGQAPALRAKKAVFFASAGDSGHLCSEAAERTTFRRNGPRATGKEGGFLREREG